VWTPQISKNPKFFAPKMRASAPNDFPIIPSSHWTRNKGGVCHGQPLKICAFISTAYGTIVAYILGCVLKATTKLNENLAQQRASASQSVAEQGWGASGDKLS